MRLFALLLLWPSVALGSLADTVGWTGGCTCVVVHPDGWALTAEHCGHKGEFEVEIAGRTVKGRVARQPARSNRDRVVLLKLDGEQFPWAAVADQPPKPGDAVRAWGFPAGSQSYIAGKVAAVDHMVHTDFRIWEGNSGGPLFNMRGQVVGIASTRNPMPSERGYQGQGPGSHWIGLQDIATAMRPGAVSGDRKPVVWVLTSPGCRPCQQLKADYKAGRYSGVTMLFVGWNDPARFDREQSADLPSGRRLAQYMRSWTGREPTAAPTVWQEGTRVMYPPAGRAEPPAFWQWFKDTLMLVPRSIEEIAGVPSDPQGEPEQEVFPREDLSSESDDRLEPIADSEPEPDFAGARLLLFAPRKLSSDTAANALLSLSRAATSQVREATDGKAAAIVISERQNPGQYAAACEATGVTPGEFAGIVMVPAQSHGLRATIRGKLLSVVRERLPATVRDAPVGLLTEVGSPKEYAATIDALAIQSAEPAQEPEEGGDPTSDEVPWYQGLIGLVTLFFGGGSKVNDRLKLALEKL